MTKVNQDADDNVPDFRSVAVRRGRNGWGRGLELTPTPERHTVISVTGGGIHPVAQRIADLSGAKVVDGFRTHIPDEEVLAAVISGGGTARIGVYPRKRIPTVDVFPGEPAGELAQFITEDIFVSAVGPDDVSALEGARVAAGEAAGAGGRPHGAGIKARGHGAQHSEARTRPRKRLPRAAPVKVRCPCRPRPSDRRRHRAGSSSSSAPPSATSSTPPR